MSHDNWKKRLEVMKLPTVAARRAELKRLGLDNMEPTEKDEGFYRIPHTVKDERGNGKNIITDYTPVALFLDRGVLIGSRGVDYKPMTPEQIIDSWTWFCGHPIKYDLYTAVTKGGEPWPDLNLHLAGPNLEAVPAALTEDGSLVERKVSMDTGDIYAAASGHPQRERVIERDHNQPPEVLPEVAAAESIDNAIGAARDLPVTTADEAAIAAGAANVIRDRRLATEKTAKSKVDPLHLAYTTERNKWLPLVKRARDAEDAVRLKVATFEVAERRRVAAEQLAALERQRELDEAAERAADRAIAAGVPETPPEGEVVAIPKAPERVTPTYGSYKPRQTEKWHFDGIEDVDKFIASIKDEPDFRTALMALAEKLVKAGRDVPGVKRHWGVI